MEIEGLVDPFIIGPDEASSSSSSEYLPSSESSSSSSQSSDYQWEAPGAVRIWVAGYTDTGFIVGYKYAPPSTYLRFLYMAM